MLNLLMNNQIWGNVKKNLGNVPELSFQLSFPVIDQKILGVLRVQQTGSLRKRIWDLMIPITVYCPQGDLELNFLSTELKIFY